MTWEVGFRGSFWKAALSQVKIDLDLVQINSLFEIYITIHCLPLPTGAFDLLIYTDKDLVVPEKWEESGPQFIANSEEVRLRSFTTTIHKVNSMVAYKKDSFP